MQLCACVCVCVDLVASHSIHTANIIVSQNVQMYFIPGLCINLSAHIGWFVFLLIKLWLNLFVHFFCMCFFACYSYKNHHIAHELAKWCSLTLSNKWENYFRLWLKSLAWWDFNSFLDAFIGLKKLLFFFFSFAIYGSAWHISNTWKSTIIGPFVAFYRTIIVPLIYYGKFMI